LGIFVGGQKRQQKMVRYARIAKRVDGRHVAGIERHDGGGLAKRCHGCAMAHVPGAAQLFGGQRRFDHDIGNAKPACDRWPQMIGGFVIEMVGDPGLRALCGRSRGEFVQQPVGQAVAQQGQTHLAQPVAGAVAAAKARRPFDVMARAHEGRIDQSGDATVAGGDRMVGRFQRGIGGDKHGCSNW
jgi:hypothetical protein